MSAAAASDSVDFQTTPRGSTPVPDPTELTDKAIAKVVVSLTQYIDGKVELLTQSDERRDREVESLVRDRDKEIAATRELLIEKHNGLVALVEERFSAAERQRAEQKQDTQKAVDAALQAQKEAVREQTTASERAIAKSETATTKQLEQQQLTVTTAVDALRRAIDEVKERAVEENRSIREAVAAATTLATGPIERRTGAREDRTSLYATIGILVTIGLALMALAGFLATRPGA